MSEFLFVYGTLARNAGHPMHRHLAKHADYVGAGHFVGRLYRVAHYPGAVPSSDPQDKVFGELYRPTDSGALFAALDEYEGDEFVRQMATIHRDDATRVQAWIYLFSGPVMQFPRIMSGRFVAASGARD